MATRSLKPKDDSMLAGFESMPERAPSIVREDQPVVARFLGLVGVFLLAVGAIAIVVPVFQWRYIIGPTWGLVFATTGLALILFHAFADHDVQFRRLYGFAALLLIVAGAVLRILPNRAGMGAWFLPYGVPAMTLGYLFVLAILRYETDAFWRNLLLRLIGAFGFVMIVLGIVVGLANPMFLAGEGVILIILGTFFVGGFIGQQEAGSDTAYYSGMALGVIGVLTFTVAVVRSLATATFFVPSGVSLMGLSIVHFALALGVCSDAPLVVLVRRELAAFFFSPIAYLLLFGSTVVAGIWFTLIALSWILTVSQFNRPVFEPIVASYLGAAIPVIIQMIIVPILTMRLLSEEKRSGTLEMLLTVPVNEGTIVLAKFIAVLIFWLLTWVPYFLFLVALRVVGGEEFDYRPLLSFGLALIASGAGFMAMGLFFSALTRNQIIAAVLTFVGMMVHLSLYLFQGFFGPGSVWTDVFQYASFFDLWQSFSEGNFAPRFLMFHVSAAVFFLYLSAKVLEARKWK
jgi:ABC-2 type transport system permease protein